MSFQLKQVHVLYLSQQQALLWLFTYIILVFWIPKKEVFMVIHLVPNTIWLKSRPGCRWNLTTVILHVIFTILHIKMPYFYFCFNVLFERNFLKCNVLCTGLFETLPGRVQCEMLLKVTEQCFNTLERSEMLLLLLRRFPETVVQHGVRFDFFPFF